MYPYKQSSTCTLYIPQDGWTALIKASFNGHHKVVDLLTNAGAAVNIQAEVSVHVIV